MNKKSRRELSNFGKEALTTTIPAQFIEKQP